MEGDEDLNLAPSGELERILDQVDQNLLQAHIVSVELLWQPDCLESSCFGAGDLAELADATRADWVDRKSRFCQTCLVLEDLADKVEGVGGVEKV